MENSHQKELDRIMAFSDGIFGVAITLLVLTIDVPSITPNLADQELPKELTRLWPQFLSYFLGFIVIGSFWITHHQKLKFIKRYDGIFLWLNIITLFLISLLPFSTNMLGDYGNSQIAFLFYALNLLGVSIMFLIMWLYATGNHRLVDRSLTPKEIRQGDIMGAGLCLVFLLSIGLSFVHVEFSKYIWLLVIPMIFLFKR